MVWELIEHFDQKYIEMFKQLPLINPDYFGDNHQSSWRTWPYIISSNKLNITNIKSCDPEIFYSKLLTTNPFFDMRLYGYQSTETI